MALLMNANVLILLIEMYKYVYNVLGHDVLWTITTFWNSPVDILGRNLDITGLAMDTVLRVDLEFDSMFGPIIFNIFVDTSRAESVFNTFVLWV
ncbi:hypothetical protein WICPIJ_003728 [Wickerhamomyces pijperi]|uniref:Uncharacterized protein n=1 Tax=Wickerhamomyces pijperi TaxID=599730 RepID=A0A9P8Q9A1_WICPI|nr:hypothetical protein WICPIJ_003728 [Wickerhamomyces pijperi]